jgi:hypothetical protein
VLWVFSWCTMSPTSGLSIVRRHPRLFLCRGISWSTRYPDLAFEYWATCIGRRQQDSNWQQVRLDRQARSHRRAGSTTRRRTGCTFHGNISQGKWGSWGSVLQPCKVRSTEAVLAQHYTIRSSSSVGTSRQDWLTRRLMLRDHRLTLPLMAPFAWTNQPIKHRTTVARKSLASPQLWYILYTPLLYLPSHLGHWPGESFSVSHYFAREGIHQHLYSCWLYACRITSCNNNTFGFDIHLINRGTVVNQDEMRNYPVRMSDIWSQGWLNTTELTA